MPSFQFDAFVTVEADNVEAAKAIVLDPEQKENWDFAVDFREFLIDGEEPEEPQA